MSVEERTHKQALAVGTRLQNYRVVRVLGVGGFGVTYLAEHVTLGHQVAIKEYLPNDVAVREGATVHPKSEAERENFEWGLQRFLDEARTLSRFAHRNVVRVRDYFEANRTACLVMDYEDGEPLDALLERHGTLTEVQLRRVLLPIVAGLKEVHAAGFLHRDIKPSNVYVRRSDESPVLLDFGAARQALGRKSKSLTAVVSAGYSPPEQYESEGEQGPWTDIYTLSALCYRAITGDVPIEAPRRQSSLLRTGSDPLPRLSQGAFGGYSAALLEAVDWGLRVIEGERPQSLEEWGAALSGESAPEPGFGRSGTGQSIRGASKAESKAPRKRTRVVVLAGGIGAVVVVAVAALWWWSSTGERQQTASELLAETDAPRVSPLEGGTAILVVETEPAGVDVLVAGTLVGQTPLQVRTVRAGVHPITLHHPEYEPVALGDQVFLAGRVVRIERTMVRATGALTVITNPTNSWVEWEGERLAEETPVTLEGLPAGTLELTLGADEFRSVRVTADVPREDVGLLEHVLEPIPYGTLTLELEPSDASVLLPDVVPAYRPGMRLAEGRYRVVVTRDGFHQEGRTVEVAGDTRERVELVANPQPFTVVTTPTGARVQFMNIDERYQPGIAMNPGEYRVRVSSEGYETREQSVRHGSAPTRVEVELERLVPQPGEVFVDSLGSGGTGPEMVVIPAGTFRMGCLSHDDSCFDTEKPVHLVRISQPFALSKYEVTRGEFSRFVEATGHSTGNSCLTLESGQWDERSGLIWRSPGFEQSDDHPVVCVNWQDAGAYVAWLSRETGEAYRLPSESEWEYAARAGANSKYSFGSDANRLCGWGNGADLTGFSGAGVVGCYDGFVHTAPVGSFAPNAFGLYDMHGNVWEWVQDCWNWSYLGAPLDGGAWLSLSRDCNRRVVRGGYWKHHLRHLRSASRDGSFSSSRYYSHGFRVARTLIP